MKYLVIGSCLSVLTAKKIDRPFKRLGVFNHLRSDVLNEVLKENEVVQLTEEQIGEVYALLIDDQSEKRSGEMLENRLRSHAVSKLKELRGLILEADFIIFDNHYDITSKKYFIPLLNNEKILSNLNINQTHIKSFLSEPPLTQKDIIKSEVDVFEKVLRINPNLKIFYLTYPKSAFLSRGTEYDRSRVNLQNSILNLLPQKLNGYKNFVYIGNSSVPKALFSTKGVLYFEDSVYEAYAKLIEKYIERDYEETFVDSLTFSDGDINLGNPYESLKESRYWKPSVAEPYPLAINELYVKRFLINMHDSIATCGSCFAQHIGKRLNMNGYNYLDVEPQPKGMSKDEAKSLGYGIYSARYGNVYTSRQLVQLFDRAFGELDFDEVWKNKNDLFVDPFRPNLCGQGYSSAHLVLDEQKEHLVNVRKMFENLDVFVFTMGVTETWINKETGAVYPICPGVTAGEFSPELYEFVNLDYATILGEMETFFTKLKEVNPKAKILLTVSPVPLTATAEDRHVLVSTMASKAILRAVADQLYRKYSFVDYFPSYDIIMSPPFKSMFFKNNLRSIHEEGVDFVMSHFFAEHKLEGQQVGQVESIENKDEEFCDEVFLELERKTGNLNANE